MDKSVFTNFIILQVRYAITCSALLALVSGCLRDRDSMRYQNASGNSSIESGSIVIVGRHSLNVDVLSMLAAKSGTRPREFTRKWALDALLAESARGGLLHSSRVQQVERSVLARALIASLVQQAAARGEPTEEELRAIAEERWFDVDRPAAAQTTHFVVQTNGTEVASAAEQLALRLAVAVRAIHDPAEFRRIVSSFPKADLHVTVEQLPPVTNDGRTLRLDQHGEVAGPGPLFDKTFAHAASLLKQPGDQSGVVHTEFGYHVIMLERILPPYKASMEALRKKYAAELSLRRVRSASEQLISRARQQVGVSVESSFQEATAQLQAAK